MNFLCDATLMLLQLVCGLHSLDHCLETGLLVSCHKASSMFCQMMWEMKSQHGQAGMPVLIKRLEWKQVDPTDCFLLYQLDMQPLLFFAWFGHLLHPTICSF